MAGGECERTSDCVCARCATLRLDMNILLAQQSLAKHYVRLALEEMTIARRHQVLAKIAASRGESAEREAEAAAKRIGKVLGFDPFDAATANTNALLEEARQQ